MFKKSDIIAFVAGLATLLFIPTPLGHVALFELASYLLAIIIIIRGGLKNFNRMQKRLILFGFLWLLSSVFTDLVREEPLSISLKANLIILSVPCVLIVAFSFLQKKKFSFLWYMIGYGISGVASLYILHNGAYLYYAHVNPGFSFYDITPYLSDKQTMPFYAAGITYSFLFPLSVFFGLPLFLLAILFSAGAAQMIIVGSRYNYLTYSLTAIISLIFLFPKKVTRKIINNSIVLMILVIPALIAIFEIYSYTAEEGMLGEFEREKYESQVVNSEYGAIGGRESSLETAMYALLHPIIGTGSSGRDQDHKHLQISGHSIIFGTWAMNGIGGLIFWAYAIYILSAFGKKFYLIDRRWLPFIMFILFEALWHILFSPFGYTRGFLCVVIAYSAIELTKLNRSVTTKRLNNN